MKPEIRISGEASVSDQSELSFASRVRHPRTMKIYLIILPLAASPEGPLARRDGGGLRWPPAQRAFGSERGDHKIISPSPPPSPARGEGDDGLFSM